ncbi:MAG: hypothetical protein ACRC6M_16315, partial [Microcystaceae cyanobacterium]
MASSHPNFKRNPDPDRLSRRQRPSAAKTVPNTKSSQVVKLPLQSGVTPKKKTGPGQGKRLAQINPLPKLRMLTVWMILVAAILGLAYKLYDLQVVKGAWLQKKAQTQQSTSIQPYIPRRSVIDSVG